MEAIEAYEVATGKEIDGYFDNIMQAVNSLPPDLREAVEGCR